MPAHELSVKFHLRTSVSTTKSLKEGNGRHAVSDGSTVYVCKTKGKPLLLGALCTHPHRASRDVALTWAELVGTPRGGAPHVFLASGPPPEGWNPRSILAAAEAWRQISALPTSPRELQPKCHALRSFDPAWPFAPSSVPVCVLPSSIVSLTLLPYNHIDIRPLPSFGLNLGLVSLGIRRASHSLLRLETSAGRFYFDRIFLLDLKSTKPPLPQSW